jgi:hypothetical protein
MKESQIQRAIMDYLAARRILAFRMNTGAMAGEYNGKQRFMRFGVVGMADILAFSESVDYPEGAHGIRYDLITPVWIEVKADTGKQSEHQKSFQKQVEERGHTYVVALSIEDVEQALSAPRT